MSLDINRDLQKPNVGDAKWVKLLKRGDRMEGTLESMEVRERTDPNGNVVTKRGTNEARQVYRIIVKVPNEKREGLDDKGLRVWEANEVAQSAIRTAYKDAGLSGVEEAYGGRFVIAVSKEADSTMGWAEYVAKFEPPVNAMSKSSISNDLDRDDFDPDQL